MNAQPFLLPKHFSLLVVAASFFRLEQFEQFFPPCDQLLHSPERQRGVSETSHPAYIYYSGDILRAKSHVGKEPQFHWFFSSLSCNNTYFPQWIHGKYIHRSFYIVSKCIATFLCVWTIMFITLLSNFVLIRFLYYWLGQSAPPLSFFKITKVIYRYSSISLPLLPFSFLYSLVPFSLFSYISLLLSPWHSVLFSLLHSIRRRKQVLKDLQKYCESRIKTKERRH